MTGLGRQLKLMSFNLRYDNPADGDNRWSQRRGAAIELIHGEAPDLLGLQEVLPNQLQELQAGLPGYEVVSHGREGPAAGERVALFCKTKVLDSGGFWLSETPKVHSLGWDASLARVALWAQVQVGLQMVGVMVTHFDHLGPISRAEGAALIKGWLKAHPGPALVLGDFNAAPDEACYEVLVDGPGPRLVDTYRAVHREEPGGTFHNWGEMFVHARIDWILCSTEFQVRGAGLVKHRPQGRWPSDHYPVVADIELVD